MIRLEAAIEGNLTEFVKAEMTGGAIATTYAMTTASSGFVNEMRQQIKRAGLGDKMANTMHSKVYPPSKPSLGAAATIYSSAARKGIFYMGVFEDGAVITVRNCKWLAIPGPGAGIKGGRRVRPADISNLKLVFIQSKKPGLAMLVYKKGRESIVYYWLLKQVTIKKKIDFFNTADIWADKIPDFLISEWERQESALNSK